MTNPPSLPESTNKRASTLRVSGYLIDEIGVHDRIMRWRDYGFWEFARSVDLKLSGKFIVLLFTFEGRKKPLKVDLSNTFKSTLKAIDVLEFALDQAPGLVLDPEAEQFLADVNFYKELTDNPKLECDAETRIAKANILLRLGDAKSTRKEIDPLLARGDSLESKARLIRLQTYFLESDSILARVEYSRINKLNPSYKEAQSLWACWRLAQGEEDAEELAIELIQRSDSLDDRINIENHLIRFFVKHRRYDDALNQIDNLIPIQDRFEPGQLDWLSESRKEIERLKTDKKYNRRVTFWRPLFGATIIYGILGLLGFFMFWPAISETPKLWSDLSNLRRLEDRGVIAQNGRFDPNVRDMDFGFVQLSYVFSLRDETSSIPTHYGNDILRRKIAKAILADTKSHSVTYLPESSRVSTVYPITIENYIGVIAEHAPAYLFAAIIISVALVLTIQLLYKELKYGQY